MCDNDNMKDIQSIYPDAKNLTKIGCNNTFIEFIWYYPHPQPTKKGYEPILVPIDNLTIFTSDNLECDKLSIDSKIKSFENMIKYLSIHIDNEIKKEIEKAKNKLYKKYKMDKLVIKLNKLKKTNN